jgi:hypothetical protein
VKKASWQVSDTSNVVPTQVREAWTAEGAKLEAIKNSLPKGITLGTLGDEILAGMFNRLDAKRGYVIQGRFVPAS